MFIILSAFIVLVPLKLWTITFQQSQRVYAMPELYLLVPNH